MRLTKAAVAAATLVLAGWGVAGGVASADPPKQPPEPKTTIDKDGTYVVGTDVVPGTYSSAGPANGHTCYWKRLGDHGSDVIDNALTKKPQVVQIEPSDKAFKTDGCQTWQKTDAAGVDGQTPSDVPGLNAQLDILKGLAGLPGVGQPPGP
jgi:hypothetical protein